MIKVQSLALISGLEEITLRAGHQGATNIIRWPYIAENNDIDNWIFGGELIFVTGLNWQWQVEDFQKLIHLAKNKDASGLVILTQSPYITSIPDEVLHFANKKGLPLFEQPYSLPMVKVTELLSNSIIKSDLAHQSVRWLMEHLLGSTRPLEMTLIKAVEFGINTHSAFFVAVIVPDLQQNGDLSRCQFLLNQFLSANNNELPLLEYHQGWLLALPCDVEQSINTLDKLQELYETLNKQGFNCYIGVSEGEGLAQFRHVVSQARQSVDFALFQQGNKVVHYSELGINQLFSGLEDHSQLDLFCQKNLGQLYNCFDKQASLLKSTLRCYFENLCSVRKTALLLDIHRNTLTNRLNKIEVLTGNSLGNAQQRLCLQNALVIERLITTDTEIKE
ncbi:MAG: PucR family transcriptional regulator ligand-binding domain-containing protein [Colwellia sp.]